VLHWFSYSTYISGSQSSHFTLKPSSFRDYSPSITFAFDSFFLYPPLFICLLLLAYNISSSSPLQSQAVPYWRLDVPADSVSNHGSTDPIDRMHLDYWLVVSLPQILVRIAAPGRVRVYQPSTDGRFSLSESKDTVPHQDAVIFKEFAIRRMIINSCATQRKWSLRLQ
jgi:hypothetical protein